MGQLRIGETPQQQVNLAGATMPAAENQLFTLYGYIVLRCCLLHTAYIPFRFEVRNMSFKNFIKENFVLVVGLNLPVLMMLGFMLSTMMPNLADPPKYSLLFSIQDYRSGAGFPFYLNFRVKDGTLYADYQPTQNSYMNTMWRKLYLYDAKTQKVQQLNVAPPENIDDSKKGQQMVVEVTKNMKLDPNLTAPDGYEFVYGGYSRSGLVNELFIGGGHADGIRLRKGASSMRLPPADGNDYYYFYGAEFIGWVTTP